MAIHVVKRAISFVGAGLLLGSFAFWLTAQPTPIYLGPVGIVRMLDGAGFDPWTGMGHGRIYELAEITGSGTIGQILRVREPGIRTWFGTRHAIPVPIGAVVAWTVLGVAALVRSRRRRA